ncbi:DUF5313 family protein [Nocardia sp. alder85J]|uniref:DUF5313 family protein n=1 Tax=Nocardia sp. alder85J TaxID=2862949 RepID=UPI001CD2FA03|nr:DUF5313 family protein [Nocardia sp. alder85J]MCX4098400.1 DUF5313 family protein [Nocardia sp. alder85J]
MTGATRPTLPQRIRYIYGATLPAQSRDWVLHDLTGPGATRRYLQRILVPVLAPLSLLLLIPGPVWIGTAMMALLYLPLIYFTVALLYVHRLTAHGLDPALADSRRHGRAAAERAAYQRRHGRT